MKRLLVLLCAMFLVFGFTAMAGATYISETEPNDSFVSAQNLDGAFSLDSDADIFWSTSYWHASVNATNSATTDVDYYSFTLGQAGVSGFFDIDYGYYEGVYVDTTMALFDSSYNALAISDDSFPEDPGSAFGFDSFIGVYTFASPGTYYLAVSNYSNFPLAYGTNLGTMTRPDGALNGGWIYSGAGPTTMNTSSGGSSSGDYVLHASLSSSPAPVPEPATMLLLGSGLVGLVGLRRKFRK